VAKRVGLIRPVEAAGSAGVALQVVLGPIVMSDQSIHGVVLHH
jgi:hypothetical protein